MGKSIDIKEFREQGYLQELNRTFLHPLGMALYITLDEDGNEKLSGVFDSRDDKEGYRFVGEPPFDEAKTDNIIKIWEEREPIRRKALGYMIQGDHKVPSFLP